MKKLTVTTLVPAILTVCALLLTGCGDQSDGNAVDRNPFQQTGEPEPYQASPSTSASASATELATPSAPESSSSPTDPMTSPAPTLPTGTPSTSVPPTPSPSGSTSGSGSEPLEGDAPPPAKRLKSVTLAKLPTSVHGFTGKLSHSAILNEDLFGYTKGQALVTVPEFKAADTYGWRAGYLEAETQQVTAGVCGKSYASSRSITCVLLAENGVIALLGNERDVSMKDLVAFSEAFAKAVGTV